MWMSVAVSIWAGSILLAATPGPTESTTGAAIPAKPATSISATEKLPPGYVRGDVVSYSYVPIRQWGLEEGIGKLPYLFEYNLLKNGVPHPRFHTENIRRINVASQWSTAIKLSLRHIEYRDEIINLMIRCFVNRELIVFADYYNKKDPEPYQNIRSILDTLWQKRKATLVSPEGDKATGHQLINNILACKLGDEGLSGLGTRGLAKVYADFDQRVRYWERDGQKPFGHIRGWYNLIGYAALDFNGAYAANQDDVNKHRKNKLPANMGIIGVDLYHFWGHGWSPFDPADLSIPRHRVRAHSDEWQRIRTKYYPDRLDVRTCEDSHNPKTWIPECFSDTHAMINAIQLAGAKNVMMWFIGNCGQIKGKSYTTPAETLDAYYDHIKAGPWTGLCWWVFADFQEGGGGSLFEGGLRLYDKNLKHYTPEHPEGLPYSESMLDFLRKSYIASKMRMFNDVVYNQFGDLNGPAPKKK